MRFSFIQLRAFEAKWRHARLSDDDLAELEQAIAAHPESGDVMKGTGGLRKLRFAPRSARRGKSGSMRVCYALYPEHGFVFLVTLFQKSEQANLTPTERQSAKALLDRISRALAQGVSP